MTAGQSPTDLDAVDLLDVVPGARRVFPAELRPGDLLFDPSGATVAVRRVDVCGQGAAAAVLGVDEHHRWFVADEPITAILAGRVMPQVRARVRGHEPGPADELPDVVLTVGQWQGNPIRTAVTALRSLGPLTRTSSSPWDSFVDPDGVWRTIDPTTEAELTVGLSGFTRAEIAEIRAQLEPPAPARRSPQAARWAARDHRRSPDRPPREIVRRRSDPGPAR